MKILHLNAGNETGGGMYHILSLLQELNQKNVILGVLEEGELLNRAKEVGIKTKYFSNYTRLSAPLLHKIIQYIKKENIQIVHTHGPRANVYVNLIKRMAPFKWIVTIHSNPSLDFMGKGMYGSFLCRLNKLAIRNADRIIAISEPFKHDLQMDGVHPNKIVTALNGIDFKVMPRLQLRRNDFGFDSNTHIFLMVARLTPIKGHHIAFEAFAEVLKMRPNCHLILLGDGESKESLIQLAKKLKIDRCVHFMGYRKDVELFYHLADTTILTSLSESFPLVLLESARAKTPVISTDVGGVGELIINDSLGWKVQPNNINQLFNAMLQAVDLKNTGMLNEMGERLYLHASSNFSLEGFAKNIYNVYIDIHSRKSM